jgi:hypothetical protein
MADVMRDDLAEQIERRAATAVATWTAGGTASDHPPHPFGHDVAETGTYPSRACTTCRFAPDLHHLHFCAEPADIATACRKSNDLQIARPHDRIGAAD